MSNKEIVDCALSLYGKKENNKFLEKLNNFRPTKIFENIKKKITAYQEKKEMKRQFEEEIASLVKQKLKSMIDEDRKNMGKDKEQNINEEIKKETLYNGKAKEQEQNINKESKKETLYNGKEHVIINNSGIIDISDSDIPYKNVGEDTRIPIYNKDVADLIDNTKSGTFIFKNRDNYSVFRKSDNEKNITSTVEFSSLGQAILYAIDDNLSVNDVKKNFDKHKNNYGNLANYVVDKRGLNNGYGKINNININNNFSNKEKQI